MPGPPPVELSCAPSAEAMRLRRWFGPLTGPGPGPGPGPGLGPDHPGWRGLRHVLVAPFAQLSFLSFDLQMFLFDCFHTSLVARVGHGLGMTGVTPFGLALLAAASPAASVGATALLLAWYAAVAAEVRLPRWWAVMVVVMAGLLGLAGFLAQRASPSWLVPGLLASGAVISISHAFDPWFPPRAGDAWRWLSLRDYILGPPERQHPASVRVARLGRVAAGWRRVSASSTSVLSPGFPAYRHETCVRSRWPGTWNPA